MTSNPTLASLGAADYTVKPTRVAEYLFLLMRVSSKVYEPYIFLVDNSEESSDLPGNLRYSKTDARGAPGCPRKGSRNASHEQHPEASRVSVLEFLKFPGGSKLSLL